MDSSQWTVKPRCPSSFIVYCSLSLPRAFGKSERPPSGLLPFDRLEQCPEVAFAKSQGAPAALDDLEEKGRPREDAFREDLQQVAIVIAVDQDAQAFERCLVLLDLAHPLVELGVVIRLRDLEELLAHPPHL